MQPPADPSPSVVLDCPIDDVACLTLARGAAFNTLTLEMVRALDEAVEEAHRRGARVLIVTGQGRAFCAGAHIDYFTEPNTPLGSALAIREDYVRPILRVFRKLHTKPFVSIAAINGFALGGGCELALSCDFRVIAADARIGLTEVRLGAIPAGGGLQLLAKIVGRARALEIVLLGDQLDADAAVAAGLATRACPPEALAAEALALAARLLKCGPTAVAEAKRAIYRCETADGEEANEIALDALAAVAGGSEWAEGMRAFMEKRPPGFMRRPAGGGGDR